MSLFAAQRQTARPLDQALSPLSAFHIPRSLLTATSTRSSWRKPRLRRPQDPLSPAQLLSRPQARVVRQIISIFVGLYAHKPLISATEKPVIQTAASHSRLVTAKLTAGPQPSTLTGPGWSRPSSTGSTVAPTPPSSTNPKPSPLSTPATTHAAPVSASAGKVIHPVPRNTTESIFNGKKDAGSKLVWGNTRPTGSGMDSVQNDFPTAAEVAQGVSSSTF